MLKTSYKKYEKYYKRFQNDQQKRNNRMIQNGKKGTKPSGVKVQHLLSKTR